MSCFKQQCNACAGPTATALLQSLHCLVQVAVVTIPRHAPAQQRMPLTLRTGNQICSSRQVLASAAKGFGASTKSVPSCPCGATKLYTVSSSVQCFSPEPFLNLEHEYLRLFEGDTMMHASKQPMPHTPLSNTLLSTR